MPVGLKNRLFHLTAGDGLELKKMLNVCKMPILLLIVFSMVANMLATIEIVGIIAAVLLFLAGLVVMGWAGSLAAKNGADVLGGAVAGSLAGAIAAVVSGTLAAVVRAAVSLMFLDIEDMGIGLFWGAVGTLIGLAVLAAAGAVCGAIGASLASARGTKKK